MAGKSPPNLPEAMVKYEGAWPGLVKGESANRGLLVGLKVSDHFDPSTTTSRMPTHVLHSIQKIRDPGMDIHNSIQKSPYEDQRESPRRHWGVDIGEGEVSELGVVERVDVAVVTGNP